MSDSLTEITKLDSSFYPQQEPDRRWTLRCYKFSRDNLLRLHVFSVMCLNGIWLGILNQKSLHKIDEIYYSDTANYYSENYNSKGLNNWEREQIETYFKDCHELLVLAAGGGRETYALQKMGYHVDAFECHEGLLNFANSFLEKSGLTPCVKFVERDECPVSQRRYDGAIVGWGAYMLIQPRRKRIEFLQQICGQIKENAPILLSFFQRSNENRIYRGVAVIANIFRFALGRERAEVGDFLEPNFVHYFTREQIEAELRDAGCRLTYFSKKPYGHAVAIREKQN